MIETRSLDIPEVLEIRPRIFRDDRGYFCETYNRARFFESGANIEWIQDNQSLSAEAGTLRGLHYQTPPFAQDKLVRVLQGRILDVAVDIRRGSPTFGRWVALELSGDEMNQILVPAGFAHGFVTLVPDTTVLYKVSAPYSSAHDRGIRWDDPEINVNWRLGQAEPVLSEKDRLAPRLSEVESPFVYERPAGSRGSDT